MQTEIKHNLGLLRFKRCTIDDNQIISNLNNDYYRKLRYDTVFTTNMIRLDGTFRLSIDEYRLSLLVQSRDFHVTKRHRLYFNKYDNSTVINYRDSLITHFRFA
jgi:hypothetical protein